MLQHASKMDSPLTATPSKYRPAVCFVMRVLQSQHAYLCLVNLSTVFVSAAYSEEM
jgi:hypothetical protein